MKKILTIIALSFVAVLFFSCSTDYEGTAKPNQDPDLNIYDTSDIISSKKTKIQWYGNDIDGAKMVYYYTVTTDTLVTSANVLTELPADGVNQDGKPLWTSTENNYAYISMPFAPYPYDDTPITMIDTTYTDPTIVDPILYKAVRSKFFVYGVDEKGVLTTILEKNFLRTNKIPKHPMIFSNKLSVNGFDKYWMTIGPDSAQMVLREQTSFWQPFDFKWMGEDPDGTDVELEFKWELYERKMFGGDSVLVIDSDGWNVNNLSKKLSAEIYDHNPQGKYAFKVYVRDDALEESLNHATVNFEVFAPIFDKGILFIDDTDPSLYPPEDNISMGNPDGEKTREFYDSLLRYSGYLPDGEASDSLSLYKIKTFSKGTEFVGWIYGEYYDDDDDYLTPDVRDSTAQYRGFYDPSIRELSEYNLVIIASDDRGNINGVDFAGTLPYTGYNEYLSSYLDVGGKVMILGNTVLMGKLYASPDQIPINSYVEPFRQVFDQYAPTVANISNGTKEFFKDYFGIYSMTFPEQKTYITMRFDGAVSPQLAQDKGVQADNYDFIGATLYDHITDEGFKALRIDSTRVKEAWWDKELNTSLYQKLSLKDNGTVFTGVPTFQAFKGEVIYEYQSIYNLDNVTDYNPNLAFEYDEATGDTLFHSLIWEYELTGETGPVLRKSGSVATRYIATDDIFRTAFFGLPTYFLDNSENQVSDMFKTMINWFEVKAEVKR